MAKQSNAAPVIIKRVKKVVGGGHHGGAWKVAYADFVTAMMAFFMLMWLLNATTEKQRKGLADYFSPTIPINRTSAGGDGALSGDSVFAQDTKSRNGTGGISHHSVAGARGNGGAADGAGNSPEAQLAELKQALTAMGGESMTMERALRHIVSRITDEGLVIEVFDLPDVPLFVGASDHPTPTLETIAAILADVLEISTNPVAVNGHLRTYPITLIDNPTWDMSTARAHSLRRAMERRGLPVTRAERVTGYGDRKLAAADPTAARNNRLEIILLRTDR
jgi:chemotaxis protein MotB